MPKYIGNTWRSRFLRAPKVAFELSSRPDFVELDLLATARLGLKTGADQFFYVRRANAAASNGPRLILAPRGSLRVTGLGGAWEGFISKRDLLPALLNPHQLLRGGFRALTVPKETETSYLSPRDIPPKGELADYIRVAERMGINKLKLVQSNASAKRWYRQIRGVERSRWALPYNSAYDYGAVENPDGAVLNGRWVGVEPLAGIEPEVLGALLNSTFVIVTRLLEGTTTGVEGAFDVGPPAVRRMVVPDLRRLNASYTSAIFNIFEEIRANNAIPAAPTRKAQVEGLRRRLDIELLRGLGCSTGEASAIVGRVYEGYARWRGAIEDIESMMRVYRREMNRQGRSRTARPADLAARRVWEEIEHSLRIYPCDFISEHDDFEAVDLPRKLSAPLQEPLFHAGVVQVGGGREIDLGSYNRVRYAAMLATIGFEPPFDVLLDSVKAGAIADSFRSELTSARRSILSRAQAYVPDSATADSVVENVQRLWFRACRERGMRVDVKLAQL